MLSRQCVTRNDADAVAERNGSELSGTRTRGAASNRTRFWSKSIALMSGFWIR